VDAAIARFAARQHGLITSAQLVAAGLSRAAVANRVSQGRLHRKFRGVYAVGHPASSPASRWLAAVLAAGDGAALSHLSAAVHWRIWRRSVCGIDVVVPRRRRGQRGFRLHWCRHLDPRDVLVRDRIPVTTVPRTLVDLSDVLTPHQLAFVIHEADLHDRYNRRATEAAMARANGRPNLAILEQAIELNAQGSAGTRSAAEDAFLTQLKDAGLPEPRVNTKIEVDFHWPDQDLVIELDGPGHNRPRTQREDQARDAALNKRGLAVVRLPATGARARGAR
jgi:very-short-patch-repair endonuclease